MPFDVAGGSYDRFMGRYSRLLAPELIAFAAVEHGMRVLDVGCGPGALTAALAAHLGPELVAAVDPSERPLRACAARVPGAEFRLAPAEDLPWPNSSFDAVLSQLVLNFLPDAAAGVHEMRRVARPGGILGSCTWDYANGMRMLRTFWDAALELDPAAPDEARAFRFCTAGELRRLWAEAGLEDVVTAPLEIEARYEDFDDYWDPFTLGVGPAGAYCADLDDDRREALRAGCFRLLGSPDGPFGLAARAWAVRGRVMPTS
ncbi:MAG: class I SAM-dependent methyltransferase [Actinomycetota bacterium]